MNLENMKAALTSNAARQVLLVRKHSPKALFVAGTVGVIGTVVLACRATLKTVETLDAHDAQAERIETLYASSTGPNTEEALEVKKNAHRKLQVNTALRIARDYAPAVGLGAASILALTGSHVILSKRNAAAMALYAGVDRAYKEYRQRVVDEYGKDIDRKFALGGESVLVEEKTADGKTKEMARDQLPKSFKPGMSPYAVLFDETSHHFTREPGMNGNILGMKQSHMNDKLRARGHLFLNEVLDELGLPRTKAGQHVGWVYRHDSEPKNGDNYVSFGIYENDPDIVDAFMNGNNPIWLDFNVDGVILDLI